MESISIKSLQYSLAAIILSIFGIAQCANIYVRYIIEKRDCCSKPEGCQLGDEAVDYMLLLTHILVGLIALGIITFIIIFYPSQFRLGGRDSELVYSLILIGLAFILPIISYALLAAPEPPWNSKKIGACNKNIQIVSITLNVISFILSSLLLAASDSNALT